MNNIKIPGKYLLCNVFKIFPALLTKLLLPRLIKIVTRKIMILMPSFLDHNSASCGRADTYLT